jgi:hypothetical protein
MRKYLREIAIIMVMHCDKIVLIGSCNIIATLPYETDLVLSCNKYSNLFKQFY